MLLTERPGAGPTRWSSDEPTDTGGWDKRMPEHTDSMGLCAGLASDVASDLLRQAQRRTVRADEVLFTAGEPARSVHVLASGAVKLVQAMSGGGQVIVKYVRPGEVFGSPALLDRFYPTSAIAVTECAELQWPSEMMRTLIERHPRVALNVIGDLEARLREMEGRLRDLSKEPVEHRLARAILKLVGTFGRQAGDGVEIPFPVGRQDLADLIGSTLPTVSRTLRAWETQRQIRRHRRRLVIADVEAVARVLYEETPPEPKPRRSHRRAARR